MPRSLSDERDSDMPLCRSARLAAVRLAALATCSGLLVALVPAAARADYDPGRDRTGMTVPELARDTTSAAHRGLRGVYSGRYADEDSLRAALHAKAAGADVIELDLRMTRDHVPILMHDATTNRMTYGRGCNLTIATHTWRQLSGCRLNHGDRITSLAAFVHTMTHYRHQIGLELELKDYGMVRYQLTRINYLLSARGFGAGNLRYESFSRTDLAAMKRVAPRVPSDWITTTAPRVSALSGQVDGVIMPLSTFRAAQTHDPGYADAFVGAGKRVMPWEVETTTDMRYVIQSGVTGLITDYVTRMTALRR